MSVVRDEHLRTHGLQSRSRKVVLGPRESREVLGHFSPKLQAGDGSSIYGSRLGLEAQGRSLQQRPRRSRAKTRW